MLTENFDKLQDEDMDNLFCSNCPYITNVFTLFRHEALTCLVMDFCDGGDLEKRINELKALHQLFDLDTIYTWTKQLIVGLDHLHNCDITHKDLKPR